LFQHHVVPDDHLAHLFFSHALNAFFNRIEELSGPDELGCQYRQTDRDNNHRRPRQYDHGNSDKQDSKANYYYDQSPGLTKRPENEMFHVSYPESQTLIQLDIHS
jgi:hypothetical protein